MQSLGRFATPPFRVEVTPATSSIPDGAFFSLETPKEDAWAEGLVIEVSGWIGHTGDCGVAAPLAVGVRVNGDLWLSAPVHMPRPDVSPNIKASFGKALSSDHVGFSFTLPVYLSAQTAAVYSLVALVEPEGEVLYGLADIRFIPRSQPNNSKRPSELPVAVLVNSLGRSGSSLLCRILSGHPQFYVAESMNQFGELRVFEFLSRLISVVTSEGSLALLNQAVPQADFNALPVASFASLGVGGEGERNACERALLPFLSAQITEFAENFIREYARGISDRKPEMRFLAEKTWNPMSMNALRVIFEEVKEVFLVRNPKNFWNSQVGFLKKEMHHEDGIEKKLRHFARQYSTLAQAWKDRRTCALLVHYEDLLDRPRETLTQVFAYIGCEISPAFLTNAEQMIGDQDAHTQMLTTHAGNAYDDQYDAFLDSLPPDTFLRLRRSVQELGYLL